MRPIRHIVNSFTRSKPWVVSLSGKQALKGRRMFCRPFRAGRSKTKLPNAYALGHTLAPLRGFGPSLQFTCSQSGALAR